MKIIYGDAPITFGDSLVITVVSMLTVFLVFDSDFFYTIPFKISSF